MLVNKGCFIPYFPYILNKTPKTYHFLIFLAVFNFFFIFRGYYKRMMKYFLTICYLFSYVSLAFANIPNAMADNESITAKGDKVHFNQALQKAEYIVQYCQDDNERMTKAMDFLKKEVAYQLKLDIAKEDDWIPKVLANNKLNYAKENIDHTYKTIDRYCQGEPYISLLIRDAKEKQVINDLNIIETLYDDLNQSTTTWKDEYRTLLSVLHETIVQYKENKGL